MFWLITRKEMKVILKDRGYLITLFLLPFLFITLMSLALGGMYGSGDTQKPVRLAVRDEDGSPASKVLRGQLERLEGFLILETADAARGEEPMARVLSEGEADAVLILPQGFGDAVVQGGMVSVDLLIDPAAPVQLTAPLSGTLRGLIEKQVGTHRARGSAEKALAEALAELDLSSAPPDVRERYAPEAIRDRWLLPALSEADEGLAVEIRQITPAGMKVEKLPSVYQQQVPGYTVMFVFFIILAIAHSLLQERQDGTFRRLLAAPVNRPTILVGKSLPYLLINLLQIGVMFAIGHYLFGMEMGRSLAGLALMAVSLGASATGLGLLVSTFARSHGQISGFSSALALVLAMLGGNMVPLSIMPEAMQAVSKITPNAWAMNGFQDVLVRSYGVGQILPEVGALLLFAAGFFSFAIFRFRFE